MKLLKHQQLFLSDGDINCLMMSACDPDDCKGVSETFRKEREEELKNKEKYEFIYSHFDGAIFTVISKDITKSNYWIDMYWDEEDE